MPQGYIWNLVNCSILLLIFLNPDTTSAQQPPASASREIFTPFKSNAVLENSTQPESNCSNGIDDDNNGLTDLKDFHCYFNGETAMDGCRPTNIIWATSNWGIHWIDLETHEERLVVLRKERTYDDITWASNGKLYGVERDGGIYEIDPRTYSETLAGDVEGYHYTNGMTGDATENIYMTSYTTGGEWHVVKFDLATKKTRFVVNLTAYQLSSAGDLCFINGNLYVSCLGNIIAKVNLATQTLEKLSLVDSPVPDGSYAMTTLGDGFLYISNNKGEIYRVDLNTMRASYYTAFHQQNFLALGFTSYSDLCNAPGCRAKLNITTDKFPPYCSNEGVLLTANGSGIKGASGYVWTLPDGSTATGSTLLATIKGKYFVNYHTVPDTCSTADSIILNITSHPVINLGKDTFICANTPLQLSPKINDDITSFYWDNVSTDTSRTITTPGKYWIEAINHCGIASDTILVTTKDKVPVSIGKDRWLCNHDSLMIGNLFHQDGFRYVWSDGTVEREVVIKKPGTYTVEVSTYCGIASDTITIYSKVDDCECFLHIPNAFTPNNDNKNDVFEVRSNCIVKGTFRIFNRWGNVVYISDDLSKGWNGRIGNVKLPSGHYMYQVHYEYLNRPGKFVKKGAITLIN